MRCSSLRLPQFILSLERCRGETAAQGGSLTTLILQILLEKQEELGKAQVCSSETEQVISVGGRREEGGTLMIFTVFNPDYTQGGVC